LSAVVSVALSYVGDITAGKPMKRLKQLIYFIGRLRSEAANSSAALDLSYTQIMAEVSVDILYNSSSPLESSDARR
jgi:hypothetical protein